VLLTAHIRDAVRAMSRTSSFAVAVVSVLALGIGATTAIFSIVNAVLLRPVPFEEPERLVRIFSTACCPTSCADAAAKSESEPRWVRGQRTSFAW
jgi:hypothetical protein